MATEKDIAARRAKMAELLSQRGAISLSDMVQWMDISDSTARRDLEALEADGLIRRTHGGAVWTRYGASQRVAFADRQTSMADEKQAIAKAVAASIADGVTVILDGGTTCYAVAEALQGRKISVVTNSVPIAALLSSSYTTEVTLIGGYVYPRTGVALGTTAEKQLEKLHATVLIMGCAGVDAHGVYNINQMMVDVERKMIAAADYVVLVADHLKFGAKALAKVCDLSELSQILTDDGLDEHWQQSIRSQGAAVKVISLQPMAVLKPGEVQ